MCPIEQMAINQNTREIEDDFFFNTKWASVKEEEAVKNLKSNQA